MSRQHYAYAIERPRPVLFMLVLAAAIVAASVLIVDGPDDVQAEVDIEADLRAAQQRAIGDDESHRIAWRVCKSMHGKRAKVLQLSDTGEYVCRRAEVTQ